MGTLFLLASLPLCDCFKLLNSKTPTGDSAKVPLVRQSKMLLGFWIPRCWFQIPGSGFRSISVGLGFRILIVSGIADSSCRIPGSKSLPKPRIPDSTSKLNFTESGLPYTRWKVFLQNNSLHWSSSLVNFTDVRTINLPICRRSSATLSFGPDLI